MSRDQSPPFQRGTTYFNGTTVSSTDGAHLEGMEFEFEDINYGSNPNARRTPRKVRCKIVRNVSGIALLPKRAVSYKLTGTTFGGQVDGYSRTTAAPVAGVVDEWLPTTGVPANDLFFIVVRGPTEWLTDIAAPDDIVVGDRLVALTAVTSQATTAGRLDLFNAVLTEAPLANQIGNFVGFALTAVTSGNTNSGLLTEVRLLS